MITMILIIGMISMLEFLLVWLPFYFDISEYTNWGKEVIWVTKNRELNWFFTYFLPPHAIMYEKLCERINGDGLALLLMLLSLVTLPVTLLMSIIGGVVMSIRWVWRYFCKTFAREEES